MWFRKNKWKIVVPALIVAILAAAFYFGDKAPNSDGQNVEPNAPAAYAASASDLGPGKTTDPDQVPTADDGQEPKPDDREETSGQSADETSEQTAEGGSSSQEAQTTDVSPTPAPQESAPSGGQQDDGTLTCTIYIQCETILNNMDLCDPNKVELVPSSGWILGETEVTFTEGETVFDVLQRVCRDKGIHLEYMYTPMYNSIYIEGIYNLYEFDVGNLSGWMYKVNGWFPNYGCSLYTLNDGDVIGWVYTCDLGYDVGGGYSTGG